MQTIGMRLYMFKQRFAEHAQTAQEDGMHPTVISFREAIAKDGHVTQQHVLGDGIQAIVMEPSMLETVTELGIAEAHHAPLEQTGILQIVQHSILQPVQHLTLQIVQHLIKVHVMLGIIALPGDSVQQEAQETALDLMHQTALDGMPLLALDLMQAHA